jgi:hypothetical protein
MTDPGRLSEDQAELVALLEAAGPMPLERLREHMGCSSGAVRQLLRRTRMAAPGLVVRTPGPRYPSKLYAIDRQVLHEHGLGRIPAQTPIS